MLARSLTAATVCALLIGLVGCSAAAPGPKTTGVLTSNTPAQLVLEATGSHGDGADDVRVVVAASDVTNAVDETTIVPWKQVTPDAVASDTTIRMSVTSLSGSGTAGCAISWGNQSVTASASGSHAVATCVATLNPKKG